MKKIKEFIKKHPYITAATCLVGGTLAGYLIAKKTASPNLVDMTNKSYIYWEGPTVGTMTLETAKQVLDMNNGVDTRFAILKGGPTDYAAIQFDDNMMFPE